MEIAPQEAERLFDRLDRWYEDRIVTTAVASVFAETVVHQPAPAAVATPAPSAVTKPGARTLVRAHVARLRGR